jgi:CBS domain-containing protein
MCKVSALLATRGPHLHSIDANATVLDALSALECENLSYLVVMHGGKYVGIFSERDYARKVILQGRSSVSTLVKEVMNADLPLVSSDDTAAYCMMLMNAYKTRYLPVFDEFEFKTVITINDLVKEAFKDEELAQVVGGVLDNGWADEGHAARSRIY